MRERLFQIELLGGPFDGTRGLAFESDRDVPPPEQMHVGRCRGDGACGHRLCAAYARSHVAFWDPRYEMLPTVETVAYVRVAIKPVGEDRARAEYVHSDLPLNEFLTDRDCALVGAGGYDGGVARG